MAKTKLFGDKKFNKDLLRLALPMSLQSFMLALVAAMDAIMLGSIDQNTMSAVSLATQIQFLQNMLIFATVTGISILAAQYWGKGDKDTVTNVFAIGLRVSLVISVITFVGCVFFPEVLMSLYTNEPVLVEIGVRYLKIAGWSYLLTGISQCYITVFKVTEHTKLIGIISVSTVVINIILNAIFIYGLLGAPRMEERGAALATLIARVIELVFCVIISYKKGFIHLTLKSLASHNKLLIKDFFRCTVPLFCSHILWGVGFTLYSALMGHLGTDAAAANSVSAVVRDLVCCLCDGLANGTSVIIGLALGMGDLERGKTYGKKCAAIAFICGGVSTVIMLCVTPLLLQVVHLTDGAREILLQFMLVMSFYMIGRAVNTIVINGIFEAGGDTIFDTYSLIVTMWCLAVPLAVLGTFVFHWSPVVVYAMTCLDEVGKIPWVMIHFRKYKWVKDLTRSKEELEAS